MHELCRNMVFRVVHFQIECHLLIICKYLLVMETPQGSDWMPIVPHCTLCQNYLSYSICNYVASTALMGTVFAFWLFFPCIFISYCDYRVNHREFLWLVVASRCQMSSDINILYHSYQQLVNTTRNGLNTKRSLYFSAYFTFLFILVNFPLTGNDLCHSQPNGISFHYF